MLIQTQTISGTVSPQRASLKEILHRLIAMAALRRQRRALAAMTDDQLFDLGLSRVEVQKEAQKPFWDTAGTLAD